MNENTQSMNFSALKLRVQKKITKL